MKITTSSWFAAALLFFGTLLSPLQAVSLPVDQDTGSTSKDLLTTALGRSTVLTVTPLQDALLRFDFSQLPTHYNSENIASARLRIYVSRVIKPGALNIARVTQDWSESLAGPLPTSSIIGSVSSSKVGTKRFIVVDVTSTVKFWLDNPSTNFGFAIQAAGVTPVTRLTLASKEGAGVGHPAELEIETGTDNSVLAWGRVTAGGVLDNGFNIATTEKTATGRYRITFKRAFPSGFSIMPAVTPEVDPDAGDAVPVGAANVRMVVTNQLAAGGIFEVFMYNGNNVLVDNDFQFIVAGRGF